MKTPFPHPFRSHFCLIPKILFCFITLLSRPVLAAAPPSEPADSSPKSFGQNDPDAIRFPDGIDPDAVLAEAAGRRSGWPAFEPLEFAHMSALGIRLIRGDHFEFYTDLAESPDVDGIVPVLDAAVGELCRFFRLDPADYADWRVEAFLVNDREPFEIFGAFRNAPEFANGYSFGSRIWIFDKKQAYYNRFLLLHELVHTFMNWTFGDLNPRWYSEGIAEYLALHSWDGENLTLGFFPRDSEEIPGFGRIERIRSLLRRRNVKSVEEIMAFVPEDFNDNDSYAWSWAFVTLLERHPRYVQTARVLPYLMTRPDANKIFLNLLKKDAPILKRDWADFASNLVYDYDFSQPRIDYASGRPSAEKTSIDLNVSAGGWQNSGLWLEEGKTYSLSAAGRYKIFDSRLNRSFPCEPNGITLRYYNGRPIGQLLAAVVPDLSAEKKRSAEIGGGKTSPLAPWDEAVPILRREEMTPTVSGTLFFRVNLPSGAAARSTGTLSVTIQIRDGQAVHPASDGGE